MSSALGRSILGLFALLALLVLPTAAGAGLLSESYGRLPLHFEDNQGQAHQDVRFLARGPGYGLYLTAGEAVLALGAKNQTVLRMALVGANSNALVRGLDELPGKANYFIGKDPSQWRTNVPTYAKVRYRGIYPGIDLVYYGNQRQLEYDFVVAPGADPKRIALRLDGADKLEIDAQGDLVLHAAQGDARVKKPVIYQDIDGLRQQIEGGYTLTGANRVGFRLAAYDTSEPLVIDPVLAYSTYLGGGPGSPEGSGNDSAFGVAADGGGNAYVTGKTSSYNFPTSSGSFQPNDGAGADGFVTKLNAAGSALVYSTYLGGSGGDEGRGIAVDAQGNAYVAGRTGSLDFPATGLFNVIDGTSGFVAKIDPTGSRLIYSTYLPAGGDGIAVDAGGNAYVTGQTASLVFPTTPGAFQPVSGGGVDAFVLKLDRAGSLLPVYSTLIGGNDIDFGLGIAVDTDGCAYVTGLANSVDFPTTADSVQPIKSGANDAFVAKLNPDGTALVYSTYLGGSGGDVGTAIALDAERNAYVTGGTASSNFPTTQGAFQSAFPGGFGFAFATKLSANGSALVYSTFLGGSDDWGGGINNQGTGVAVDAGGNAFVTGYTYAGNFPTTPDAVQPVLGGTWDAFVTKLDRAGSSLLYSTFLGGTNGDAGTAITVDAAGNAYVSGESSSGDFPTTPGAFQPAFHGGGFRSSDGDAFVVKFSAEGCGLPRARPAPKRTPQATEAIGPPTAPRPAPSAAARFAPPTRPPPPRPSASPAPP